MRRAVCGTRPTVRQERASIVEMARGDEQTHDGRARGWQSADGMKCFSFWTYGTAAPLPHWATLLHHYQKQD